MPAVRKGGAARWARRSANAAQDYKEGVENPTNNWEANTVAAHETYKAAVVAAANEGRQMKGVKKSGQAWWQKQSSTLGPGRFAEGVQQGEATYQEGVAPFTAIIENTKLPARGPKGDPRNYERSKTMGMALHNAKKGAAK